MNRFIKSQYVSVIAVTAITLSAYYWTVKHTNQGAPANRVLVSSLGSVPYSSGIHLSKQIFAKKPERSPSSIKSRYVVDQYSKGDINGDGVISYLDLQYAELTDFAGNLSPEKKQNAIKACDMNSDKKCSKKDLDILTKKYVLESGDVNGDGRLTDSDLVLAQRIVERKEQRNTRLPLMKLALNGRPTKDATAKDLVKLEKKLAK